MSKYIIIFSCISAALGGVIFIATDNLIIAAAVLLVSFVVSLFWFIPKITKFNKVTERYHECYHFINNYIISLSIKNSIAAALESTSMSMGNNFLIIYNRLEDLNEYDKLKYLDSYFPFHSYKLFLQIVDLWQEEGGDVLTMSNYLLGQIRYEEEYVNTITSLARRKYIECTTLWIICVAIIVLLRFTLNDFYLRIKNQVVFIVSLVILSLFILFSIYLLIDKATKISLKGYNKNEKII